MKIKNIQQYATINTSDKPVFIQSKMGYLKIAYPNPV